MEVHLFDPASFVEPNQNSSRYCPWPWSRSKLLEVDKCACHRPAPSPPTEALPFALARETSILWPTQEPGRNTVMDSHLDDTAARSCKSAAVVAHFSPRGINLLHPCGWSTHAPHCFLWLFRSSCVSYSSNALPTASQS